MEYKIKFFEYRVIGKGTPSPVYSEGYRGTYRGTLVWAEMVQCAYGLSYIATHPCLKTVESIVDYNEQEQS